MNLNDLKETKDFSAEYITKEQRAQAEYEVSQGYNTYIEGPYNCRSGKVYCYIWAVKIGKSGIKKIDGRGYNIR